MSTYLGQKGYTIYKDSLEVKEQLLIRKELEVSPWVPKSSFHKPPSFPIYRESKKVSFFTFTINNFFLRENFSFKHLAMTLKRFIHSINIYYICTNSKNFHFTYL